MIRNALFASLIALGAAGAAQAQAQAPDTTGLAVPATGNVVGGGGATIVGGGDNTTILYSGAGAGPGGAIQAQPPRLARAQRLRRPVGRVPGARDRPAGPRGVAAGRRRQRPGGLRRPPR